MQTLSSSATVEQLQDETFDVLVLDVLSRIDRLARPLNCYRTQLRHVVTAAQSGAITIEPGRIGAYLLGALHACAREIDADLWAEIEPELERLSVTGAA